MITLNNVSVTFDQRMALQHVSAVVHQGEFITIVGSNGAGKSTLMRILAGQLQPTAGAITIDGHPMPRSVMQRAQQVAKVFQNPTAGTFSHLTVLENLSIAYKRGQRRGLERAMAHTEVFCQALLKLNMGLEKRLHDRVSSLSGGQRQALSLVMATLQPSKILLLDEHTAALDPQTGRMMMARTVATVQEHHLTTFMITHNMSDALKYGSRTWIMREGVIQHDWSHTERQQHTPEDLYTLFFTD
jgi:putative tryptophan/tyrosine transport system ATP-binding protein